jgi:hypothetical protein
MPHAVEVLNQKALPCMNGAFATRRPRQNPAAFLPAILAFDP